MKKSCNSMKMTPLYNKDKEFINNEINETTF